MRESPSIERMAETLDKLEEDALQAAYPTVHADCEVLVRFDRPIELAIGKEKRMAPAELTDQLEQRVQSMLDDINAQRTPRSSESPRRGDIPLGDADLLEK
ncbi:MAG TPA: hypothetical protein VM260_25200 [Pirellula sp.]|nr:hypothetical protein [Pirellula sp.]